MEVIAKTKINHEAVEAMVYASIFKKKNPKVFGVIFVVAAVIFFMATIAMAIIDPESDYYSILKTVAIILMTWAFIYFRLPKISYKQMGKVAESENYYVFSDVGISVTNEGDCSHGESEYTYEAIERVIETKKYFFIFINKAQAYIVAKDGITNGSAEDLRSILSKVGDKRYILSKY